MAPNEQIEAGKKCKTQVRGGEKTCNTLLLRCCGVTLRIQHSRYTILPGIICSLLVLIVMFVIFPYFFEHLFGNIGIGPGAIRALWSVYQAHKVCFSAGVGNTISMVSVRDAIFCTYVPVKSRRLAALSGAHSPVRAPAGNTVRVRHPPALCS